MTTLLVDASNYTPIPTAAQCRALREAGYTGAMIQSIDPPADYPRGNTRELLNVFEGEGFWLAAYPWKWFGVGDDDIRRKLDLLDGWQDKLAVLSLDVEDTNVGALRTSQIPPAALARIQRQPPPQRTSSFKALRLSADGRADEVERAFELCDAFLGKTTALYTGTRWYWGAYMGGTTRFSNRPLHDAQYNGLPDATLVTPGSGGWPIVSILQFAGTSTVGTLGNLDLNAVHPSFEAALFGGSDVTDPEREAMQAEIDRLTTDKNGLVSSLGLLAGDSSKPLRRKTAPKYVKGFLAQLDHEADAHQIAHA